MLGIDGEYPAGHTKGKFWHLYQNCVKSAVKHYMEKPKLRNFVKLNYVIGFSKERTKSHSNWHLHKQWLYKYYKVYGDEIKTQNRQKTQKDERLVFQKNR